MSHPMYNPFAPGKQISPQGPYGLSGGQMGRNPRRPLPHLGSGSSFSSSGTSVNRGPTGGPLPSLLSLQVNYRPEKKKMTVDEDIERCLDLNISRAREEAMQNFASQNSQFTKAQRGMSSSSNTGMSLYLTSSGDSGSTPLDWASAEESSKMYSSASSSFLSSGDGGIQAPMGLLDYDSSMSDQAGPPCMYTSESATNILLHFGLQKEDLDHLTSYPEDQITPENLPFILRQIRLEKEKAKRTPTAVHQSKPYSKSQNIRSVSEMDKLSTSRGPMLNPDELSTFLQPSNVIDYGHTSKSELSSFGPLNNDIDLRHLKSEVPTTLQLKKPPPAHQVPLKTQLSKPPSKLIHGIHPGHPGLHSNPESHSNDQMRSGGQPSNVTQKKKKKKNKGRPPQWQQVQILQQPTQPEGFPASKPAPLLLIPGRHAPPTRGPSQMDVMTRAGPSSLLPTPAMMQDYAAATPRLFPHTCCLCMKECTNMKDWLSHQNTSLHLKSCRRLRERYPEWDGSTLEFLSALGKDTQFEPSTHGQNLQNRHQKSIHETLPYPLSPHRQRGSEDRREKRFSPSGSHSPHLYHASESRRERRSSRSRSPQTSRHAHRSRSRSHDHPASSRHRSRSRSYERWSPPRKREAKRRSHEHRSSPRRSDEKRLPRRSHERRSPAERSVPQSKRSRSADRLAKRLLEKTVVQSLSKQSDLEAMVKTLAPVLLAELANLKSSSAASSSSSSKTEKKTSSSMSTKAKSSRSKSGTSSSTKSTCARSISSSKVNLSGVYSSLSHTDIVEALEKLGKVKCVILYRSTLRAQVQFEKEEDAKKLQSLQSYQVKGLPVFVDSPTGPASKKPPLTREQKRAPQKKSATSSATKSQTTKSNFTGRVTKPLSSTAKSTTTGKLVTRAKVLVSKAKGVSMKQVAKTVKKPSASGKRSVKSVGGQKEASVVPKSKTPGKRPHVRPSDPSKNKKQPAPQTSSSAFPTAATSAGSVFSDSAKAGSTFADVKAGKQVAEEVTAELPQMDENIFKVLSTAINKHRHSTGISSERKDKESTTKSRTTPEETKKENTRLTKDKNKDSSSGRFDVLDFNSGDFVTVDEFNEELDDTTLKGHPSSSKTTSREKKDRRSSAVHSAARKTSARSAFSSSKPAKGNLSSRSTSVSENKQKSTSKPMKSSSGHKTSTSTPSKSVKAPASSGQKAQSNKRKPPVTSSEPSSSGRSTRSSATAIKSSVETQQVHKKDLKPREVTVAKSDHKVSAESCAANTVESELKIKTPEKNQPAEGQISQIQNLKTDFKEQSVNEMKRSKAMEMKQDTDGKITEEERGNNENKEILDSLNEKSDEQKNKEDNQDRRTETQISGPAQDQIIHQGGPQVVENDEARSDECHEMEVDESTKQQDGAPEDQAATADDGDEGSTMMQVSEKDETKGAPSCEGPSVKDTPDRNEVTSEDTNQIQSSSGVAANVKQKDEILLSEKNCKTYKEVGQISGDEDQPLENSDSKDTSKDQKLVGPTDLQSKADNEPTEEEVYQVIDSLEDQPTTTEAESETEKKERTKENVTTSGEDRPTRHGRSRSRTSKSEEKEKSAMKQEKTVKKHEGTKEMKKEKEEKNHEDFEEMVYEVVDSIEDDSVQETSTTESPGRSRRARGNKKGGKTSAPVEEPKKPDKEEMFTVLDSVEEESPSDKPVVTRSTRGRREGTAKKVEENTKTKEDKTPTRRGRTPARDSQEKDKDKTPKTDVCVPLKESTPTKKSDAVVTNPSEEDATYEEMDAVRDDLPITRKSRRGRPKKDSKTSKKLTEEEEPVHQIASSLGGNEFQEKTATVSSLQKESETKDEMVANVNTVPSVSSPKDLQQAIGKEENLLELDENAVEAKEDPSAEGSDAEKKRSTSKTDLKKEDKSSLNQPKGKDHGLEKRKESPKMNSTTAAKGVSLKIDQVSAEEKNYPDDTTEEAELTKIQAAATKTENEQEDRSMERETVERRSQSSVEGGESGKTARHGEQNHGEDMGAVELDTFGSAISNETGENVMSEAMPWDRMITEGEPQELVALNEIAEKEEDPKEKQETLEAQPQIQDRQSVDPLKPENMSALNEAGQKEDKEADEEDTIQTSSSFKRKHNDDTGVDKRRQELTGPEAKRSRSQSPSVAVDLQLPPFDPENPLGEEFVVPKSGFFCNLCSVFYLNESTAKKIHCSSQKHYNNLLKHYQKLRQKTSGTTTQSVQD